jgi:hypothetical protein
VAKSKTALKANPPLEVKRRLKSLLDQTRRVPSPEILRRLRAIEVLEDIGSKEAQQILVSLAGDFSTARETQDARASLARLAKGRAIDVHEK